MRMFRLNTVNGKHRSKITLTTHESGDDAIALRDETTIELVMDENPFLSAGADVRMQIGGEKPDGAKVTAAAVSADDEAVKEAVEAEIRSMAAALYPHLSESAKEKISNGL